MIMRIAITGHRPEDLPDDQWVKDVLREGLVQSGATHVIQGMAAGVDLWSAVVAWHLGIPYTAAKPWTAHGPRRDDEYTYRWVERHAQEVVNVTDRDSYPGAWVYHVRNEYMVDNADAVLAVWTGKMSGGTAACVKYARKVNKPIFRIDPATKSILGWDGLPDPTLL